jgi:hypothetical protein
MEDTKKLNKKPEEKKKKKKVDENEPNYYHRTEKEAYKFHDLHRQKGTVVRPDTTPTCTKYLPSKKLVWRKTINWPGWETMRGRMPFVEEKNSKFYINHGNILSQVGPCLINMNKQTMRGDSIPESHNLRIITTRPFTPNPPSNHNIFLKNSTNRKSKNINIDKNNKVFIKNNYKINRNSKASIGQNRYNYVYDENQKNNNNERNTYYMNKRGVSAATSSTRPQTGKPLNINRFQSRPTTSSPTGTVSSNKNIVDNNNVGSFNTNKSHITSKSASNEEEEINDDVNNNENDNKISQANYNDNNLNNNSISEDSSDLNDSYHKFKNVYQRQIKKKNLTENKMSKNSIFDKNKYKIKNKNMKNMKLKIESSNSYNSLLSSKKKFYKAKINARSEIYDSYKKNKRARFQKDNIKRIL